MTSHHSVPAKVFVMTIVMGTALLRTGLLPSGFLQAAAEEKESPPKGDAAISQAVVAYQLAIEGQHTKSPILMLAATEMIGMLKAKDPPPELTGDMPEEETSAADPISFDISDSVTLQVANKGKPCSYVIIGR